MLAFIMHQRCRKRTVKCRNLERRLRQLRRQRQLTTTTTTRTTRTTTTTRTIQRLQRRRIPYFLDSRVCKCIWRRVPSSIFDFQRRYPQLNAVFVVSPFVVTKQVFPFTSFTPGLQTPESGPKTKCYARAHILIDLTLRRPNCVTTELYTVAAS